MPNPVGVGKAAPPHGRLGRYERGCRCPKCTAANDGARIRREQDPTERTPSRRWRKQRVDPAWIPHGLVGYNNYNCRCQVCRGAATQRYRERQDESQATLKRSFVLWTEEELAVARNPALTAREVAAQLGRSYAAVKSQRAHRTRMAEETEEAP